MKVALLLPGHLRTHNCCYDTWIETFSRNLDYVEVDVFVHTWDVIGTRLDKDPTHHLFDENADDKETALENMQPIEEIFGLRDGDSLCQYWSNVANPLKYVKGCIESYTELGARFRDESAPIRKRKPEGYRVLHIFSHWYKVAKCYEMLEEYMKQTNTKYDAFIRGRPDIRFSRIDNTFVWDWNDLKAEMWLSLWKEQEPHDFFAVTRDQDFMKKYCSLYYNLTDLYDYAEQVWQNEYLPDPLNIERQDHYWEHRFWNPHYLLYYHLKREGVPFVWKGKDDFVIDIVREQNYEN